MYGILVMVVLQSPSTAPPVPYRADVVLRWNAVARQAVRTDRTPPPKAARNLALMHTAIYDAVNAIEGTHKPYRITLSMPESADPSAAAAVAAHRCLSWLYPKQRDQFDDALDASLAKVPRGPAKTRGIHLGKYVADRLIAWRREDGSDKKVAYRPKLDLGVWRPTPPGYLAALLPQWSTVTPFAIKKVELVSPPAPPAITDAEFTKDYKEVKALGGLNSRTRSADQTLIALFWDDGVGTSTPVGHWNVIAAVAARKNGNTLAENARLFALLNICMADAAITCWDCKFKFKLWRPVTAIRSAHLTENTELEPDKSWQSLITTPPFPSYTSGHSTFSGAASKTLAHFYGTDKIAFKVGSEGLPGHVRHYKSFSAAADEAGRSRIFGGIHYECDNREGLKAGKALAVRICRDYLTPRSKDDKDEDLDPTKDPGRPSRRPLPKGKQ
jgi:hypothetical protein